MEVKYDSKGKGINFLLLSLGTFCGIMIELIYAFFLEPAIYRAEMNDWTTVQMLIHWTITCISWGAVAWMLVKAAKQKYQYDLFQKYPPVKAWQWCIVAAIIIFAWIYSYMDWK